MGLLKDKKITVVLALIVIIIGSIAYFMTDVPNKENSSMKDDAPKETTYNDENPNTTSLLMIENEAII